MKKYLILMIILDLTGCTTEYNLTFDDEIIKEQVIINVDTQKNLDELKSMDIKAISDAHSTHSYKVTYEEKKKLRAIYSYTYNLNNINRAAYLNQCFDSFSFIKRGTDDYIFSTSTGFKCINFSYTDMPSVKVTITTNRRVSESNADNVERNTYTWHINENNANDKRIYINFKEVKKDTIMDKIIDNKISLIILGSILLLMIIVGLYIFIKGKKNNEI